MNESEDLYEILQVHPTAHQDVITAAYRRLTLLYHPDRNPSEEAAEMMKRLNLAYETLSNPGRRAAYDLTRADRQRQRTRAANIHREARRPSASRATTGTPRRTRADPSGVPSKLTLSNDRKIILGIALVVVIAVVVRFATDGGGATDDQGTFGVASSPAGNQFQVSLAPTSTPRPTAAPYPTRNPTAASRSSSTSTPRQTDVSAPIQAPSAVSGNTAPPDPRSTVDPSPTATPHLTSAPVPTVTATLVPTTIPTPIPVPTAAPQSATETIYFSRGSSQDDVLLAQGTPTKIDRYEASRKEIWHYGWSTVTFSLPDGLVTEWNNDGNLNVSLISATSASQTPGYFTLGSSQDDVLLAQGTPTKIDRYEASRKEVWHYGWSTVTFSLPDGLVTEWNNDGNLNVSLISATSASQTPGYFTLGSSQDDVLLAQGTPTKIDRYEASGKEVWHYGWSTVTFSLPDGLVTEWNNDGNLNVSLISATSASQTPGYFTLGSSQDDVLLAQGTPTKIDRYEASGKEVWHYGWSTVTFSLPDGLVTEWNNDGNLNVSLISATSASQTPGYFTLGSSQDDVLPRPGYAHQDRQVRSFRKRSLALRLEYSHFLTA